MSIDTNVSNITETAQKGEYKVVFKGNLLPGYNIEQVVDNIAQLTKLPPEKIKKKFFNGKVVIIRRAHDKTHAQKLQHLFTEAGLEVFILRDMTMDYNQQEELPPQNIFMDDNKPILIGSGVVALLLIIGIAIGINISYLIVITVFLTYFVLHTLTASIAMKQWVAGQWPELMPWYRLAFNAVSIILLIPLLVVMFLFPGETLWIWHGVGFYLTSAVAVLAIIGFFYSLTHYDLAEFWGTRQLKEGISSVQDQENFHISPFHRYVRHPWYFFALVLIWTRDVSTVQLLVYSLVTAYFVIGSKFEEKKLIAYHGEVYKKYQQKVAGIIPLPWKILSAEQAQKLLHKYYKNK